MRTPTPYGGFLLLDRIAVGGMAEVFVARRREGPADRLFAVKRLLPTLAEDGEFLTMFLDEARLVVQLDHPGIVPIHELGKQGDGYYIAMDYVPGKDLRALLERARAGGEPLPVPLAAHVAARVADALDHAHRKRDATGQPLRVVHRDVSPANVLLGFDGSVRIIDFGIAQAALRTRRQDTVLRGKFGYMSPEIVRGLPVDRRSDVFALGVVLHEMLTGERLFRGGSELAVLDRVRNAEVPRPSSVRRGLPPALDAVVLRALAREPEDRFAWASELRDALLPFARGGAPPGDPPALARRMARTFPAELRAELDRLERARAASAPEEPPPPEPPEPTQVIDLRAVPAPAAPRASVAGPFFHLPPPPAREPARPPASPAAPALTGRSAVAALAAAILLAAGALLASGAREPRAEPAPSAPATPAGVPAAVPGEPAPAAAGGTGRLLVQPLAPATLVLDGVPQPPPLGASELRALTVPAGLHRVELRTDDGRRAGATVDVRPGEDAELLSVELQ